MPLSVSQQINEKSVIESLHGKQQEKVSTHTERQQQQQQQNQQTSKKHNGLRTQNPSGGAFVHIAKTGGSTLSVLLKNGCHSFMPHPCRSVPNESLLSRLVQSYYHVPDFRFLLESKHTFYMLTLRDPFDRTVSAFCFEHIRNREARNESVDPYKIEKYELAYQCFPSLQAFTEHLGVNSRVFQYPYKQNMVVPDSCRDLARAALYSRVKLYNHLYFSYEKIFSFLPNPMHLQIYIARQEHLWDDWKRINIALGQPEQTILLPNTGWSIRNTTDLEIQNKLPVSRDLNAMGRMYLCHALEQEYKLYFWFLTRAKNLQETDVQDAVAKAKRNCPVLPIDQLVENSRNLIEDEQPQPQQ